jgi:hypothetical protein
MKKLAKILIIFLLIIVIVPLEASAETSMDLLGFLKVLDLEQCLLADYKCYASACRLKGIPIGDIVCHNVPVGFVETTVAPFTTTVPFVGAFLDMLSNKDKFATGGTSGNTSETHLQYFEAHVFNVPTRFFLKLRYPLLKLCNYRSSWEINYLSEIDAINWRTGLADYTSFQFLFGSIAQISQICTLKSASDSAQIQVPGMGILDDICMGTWGITYPRVGFSNANSEPVASGIVAYRASRVVAKPFLRTVLQRKQFDPNLKMQLGYPKYGKPLNCFLKGTTPAVWDNLTTKLPKGTGYIWVLWEKRCCCSPPPGCGF